MRRVDDGRLHCDECGQRAGRFTRFQEAALLNGHAILGDPSHVCDGCVARAAALIPGGATQPIVEQLSKDLTRLLQAARVVRHKQQLSALEFATALADLDRAIAEVEHPRDFSRTGAAP